ncbi:meiosis-specific kinetochore protein [Ambystoma mexicanum]|uniref:meiosis-specific kinetochore protein n=1 Tax=Ambystoma mexicanum TaxID=8296 RepID=UPI0037E7A097
MEMLEMRKTYARKKRGGGARCSSPVPPAPPHWSRGYRPGVSYPTETLRLNTKMKGKVKKNTSKKLPNILENEKDNTSMSYTTEKYGIVEAKWQTSEESIHVSRVSLLHRTESTCSNLENKTNTKTGESTSGISVPTGVSSYMLDCLTTVSALESTVESSSVTILSSPEIFRGTDECSGSQFSKSIQDGKDTQWFKCKNSTLLDTTKAVDIESLPQFSNVSQIRDAAYKKEAGSQSGREHPTVARLSSVHISTIIAGKTLCKIMPDSQETPKLHKQLSFSTTLRSSVCKKKVKFSLAADCLPACVLDDSVNASTKVSENLNTHSSAMDCSTVRPQCDRRFKDVEERRQELRRMIETKSYTLCNIVQLTQKDLDPEPVPVPWTPRPTPKGIPIDYLTLF